MTDYNPVVMNANTIRQTSIEFQFFMHLDEQIQFFFCKIAELPKFRKWKIWENCKANNEDDMNN